MLFIFVVSEIFLAIEQCVSISVTQKNLGAESVASLEYVYVPAQHMLLAPLIGSLLYFAHIKQIIYSHNTKVVLFYTVQFSLYFTLPWFTRYECLHSYICFALQISLI